MLRVYVASTRDATVGLLNLDRVPPGWKAIPNIIDSSHLASHGTGTATRLWTDDGLPVVLAADRLAEVKGFDVLLRAHAKLLQGGLKHRLVRLGGGYNTEQTVEKGWLDHV